MVHSCTGAQRQHPGPEHQPVLHWPGLVSWGGTPSPSHKAQQSSSGPTSLPSQWSSFLTPFLFLVPSVLIDPRLKLQCYSNQLLASINSASVPLHLLPPSTPTATYPMEALWSLVWTFASDLAPLHMIQFTDCCQTNVPQINLTISLTYFQWFLFPFLYVEENVQWSSSLYCALRPSVYFHCTFLRWVWRNSSKSKPLSSRAHLYISTLLARS